MEVVFPMQITDTWFAISIKVPVQRMLFDKILNMFWNVVCRITYFIKTKGTIEMYSYYPFFGGFLFVFFLRLFYFKMPFHWWAWKYKFICAISYYILFIKCIDAEIK